MAFVSRAARKLDLRENDYGAHLGPGAYGTNTSFGQARPNYAPFATTTRRSELSGQALANPGPGSYQIDGIGKKEGKTNMFKSGTQRFTSVGIEDELTPGPGSYVPKDTWKGKNRGRGRKSHPQERAVSWIRVPTAPSIPVKLQSHGYEEGKFGELVMQGPDEEGHDGIAETVGPGHYDPSDKFLAGKKTRVANFSKYAGRTDETKKVANIPGPGYYDTTKEITSPNKNKPSAAFRSTVNRSTGAAPKKKRTNSTPGPGQYTVQESFKKQNVPEERQFFGSSSRRFADNSLPVTINAPIYYGETVPATSSIAGMRPPGKQVAFHGSAPRFREGTQKPRGTTAPGVGQYDLPQSFEVERKEGKSGPFGSSVRRFWKPSNKVGIPGPGTYSKDPVPSQKTKTLIDKASAVFQSSGSRFVDGGGNLKEKRPSPGEYDITRSWDQAGKNGLMSSGNPRFFDKKDKAHLGPGTYKVESSFELEKKRKMVNRKNILVSKAGRFSFNGTGENPGPGQYDSQNPYDQMTKPTFNMTIAQGTLVSPL